MAALVPAMLAVGAGLHSSVRQCNQDASTLETQLTSILLEMSAREARTKWVPGAADVPVETLRPELVQIKGGAENTLERAGRAGPGRETRRA
jgi:hypothetical protein